MSSLERITESSIKAVTDAFSLAELFTYGTWHLADSSVRLSLTAATETIQLLDGVFGSTETSRAISSLVTLIQEEIRRSIFNGVTGGTEATILGTLGSIAVLGSVSKALTAFACLQTVTYQRSLRERKRVEKMFDGLVVRGGGIGGEEGDVSLRWHRERVQFDGEMTRVSVKELGVRQKRSFQNLRMPVLMEDLEEDGIVTLEDAKVLVQQTQLQGAEVEVLETGESVRVKAMSGSVMMPKEGVSMSSSGQGGDRAFLDRVSRDFSGKDMQGLLSDFEQKSLGVGDGAEEVEVKEEEAQSKGKAWTFFRGLYGSKQRERNEAAKAAEASPIQSKTRTLTKRRSVVTMFDETRSTQQSADGSRVDRYGFRVNNHQMEQSETQSLSGLFPNDGYNYKQYPLPHLLRNLERYCRFASASYGAEFMKLMGVGNLRDIHTTDESIHANHFAFSIHAGIPVNDIILSSCTDYALAKPVHDTVIYYVTLDREAKVVVVALRGTLALNDVLTDLKFDYADFMGHRVHSGMLRSAALLYRKGAAVREAVRQALEDNPTYGLVITGHSLGGGVAALLALRWACRTTELGINPNSPYYPPTPFVTSGRGGFPRGRPIHCYSYGSPCVVSLEFSAFAKGLVSTLVNGDDIVPTLSVGLVRDMKAVTMSLLDSKNRGLSEKIIWKTLGFHGGSSASSVAEEDYFWNVLTQLKGGMTNERLYVAGNAYWMVSSETVTTDGTTLQKKCTWHVTLERIDDVREMNQEPRFSSRLISDHFPTNYEQTLGALVEAAFGEGK
ncbi:alpha/beta-hydrolase [Rhizoclosmatium globosum]|uniref:sn-1-specific diacylglycerol lipase n=1 Tax=Rhizoclosmatium globosum TaxID=329046 RepID=A0A1Y2D3B4_9FUNG|nr:alpha/beta-hydrolase [Rhizoclosmatium globosum]|eukprot:ORY53772.1 alpha/beta-hydrolase [Rhizoclosmatium globosum]